MDKLKWKWVYIPYLDAPEQQKESAIKAGYAKVCFKSEVDATIADLKKNHDAEIGRLRAELEYSTFRPDTAKAIEKLKRDVVKLKSSLKYLVVRGLIDGPVKKTVEDLLMEVEDAH